MRARQRTLLSLGALALLAIVAFNQLAGMSLRFFGASMTVARAFAHYLAGDYAGAARLYREDLKRSVARGPVDATPSWALLATGDLDGAERRARVEARAMPTDVEPLLTLAEVALARRDSAGALQEAGRVLGLRRDDADAVLVTAVAHARQGAADAAIEAMKRAHRIERAERRATVFLAVLEVVGELDDRPLDARPNCLLAHLHHYLRLSDPSHADPAIRYAQRAIHAEDRADDAHVVLALIDAAQGRPTRGFGRLRQALAVNPRNAAALLASAHYRASRGEVAEEYRLLRTAFEADPDDPFVVAALHRLLVQRLGDDRQALVLAAGVIARNPRDAEAWGRHGYAQARLGDPRGALQSYQQAASLGPRTAELEDRTGQVLLLLGRDAEAFTTYQRAVALDPLRPGPHHGLAALHAKARRWNDATREAEMGLALGGRDLPHVVALCGLYVEQGRKAEATRCLAEALALDPYDAQALALQGQLSGTPRSASATP